MNGDPVSSSTALPPPYLNLAILSARYGPCEHQHQQHRHERANERETNRSRGLRQEEAAEAPIDGRRYRRGPDSLPTSVVESLAAHKQSDEGCSNNRSQEEATKHDDLRARRWSRDVASHVVRCLRNSSMSYDGDEEDDSARDHSLTWTCDGESEPSNVVRIKPVNRDGMMVTLVLVELPSVGGMNLVFGDPCPGTTKRLYVEYTIEEPCVGNTGVGGHEPPSVPVVNRMSFAEQEPVVLRRHSHRESNAGKTDPESRPRQNSTPTVMLMDASDNDNNDTTTAEPATATTTALSELILPLTLPWLKLPDRVACRQVCVGWRSIVQTWGLATTIDSNEFDGGNARGLTVPVLTGLLLHSFASLQSLYVSGMTELQKRDLHPALASMRRLRAVDVSDCPNLDDETLRVLSCASGSVRETLQVLYIKGLRKVTDSGLVALASCQSIRVLDVSRIPSMTDESGICLGRSLVDLRAFYCRDNYQITQRTVGALVETCPHLEQLTLWGCTRLKQLHRFPGVATGLGGGGSSASAHPLVLLNLWGCHSLDDDAAQALVNMRHLKTLIVSECHKLTDLFLVRLAYARYIRSYSTLHALILPLCFPCPSSPFASKRPNCST
jgi:hypothetical protein